MKAIILAGGKGTRLLPYTTVFPKPMLPVGEKPILEIIIRQLTYYGFNDIILSVGYLAEIIRAYFHNDNIDLGEVDIKYLKEEKPLGTAGPIGLVPDIDESFLVMNGDVLTTIDYNKLLAFHKEQGALMTISISKKQIKIDLGIVEIDGNKQVTDYIEKPTYTHYDSMGIYIYEPRVLKYIEEGVRLDVPELVLRLIENGEKVFGYYHDDPYYWVDIGQQEDYQKAIEEFERRKEEFLPE